LDFQKKFVECHKIEKHRHEKIESSETPITLLCPYESNISKEERLALKESHNRDVVDATLDMIFEINRLI
jgi:hypothetical protein